MQHAKIHWNVGGPINLIQMEVKAVPMEWSDPGPHQKNNCYVCANPTIGINQIKRKFAVYHGMPSAKVPIKHSEDRPVPEHPSNVDMSTTSYVPYEPPSDLNDPEYIPPQNACLPSLISQEHLDRIVRKLNLSQNGGLVWHPS